MPIKLEVYVNSNRFGEEFGYFECLRNKVTNLNKVFLDHVANINTNTYFLLQV